MSASFPLVINFQGDYGMKVLFVDPQSSLADVAQTAKNALVGVVVKPLPENVSLEVRRHREAVALNGALKVADAGLVEMEALDIVQSK